jgi:hypothetical protein
MKNSPWFTDEAPLSEAEACDDTCDRVYRAVISAVDKTCVAEDSAADVLYGLMEALCFLCITLLDPNKSEEEGKEGFFY